MEPRTQFDVPEIAEEYGTETFEQIAYIAFDPEFGWLIMEVDDADVPDGFYQYCWEAEERDGEVVITGRAVGVPAAADARELDHITSVDILDEIDGIRFEEDEQ